MTFSAKDSLNRVKKPLWKCTVLSLLLVASTTMAYAQSTQQFSIPAGKLSSSLSKLALKAGVLLTGDATLTKDKSVMELKGTMTIDEAFAKLLKGTGLTFSKSSSGDYILSQLEHSVKPIEKTGTINNTELSPLVVRGTAPARYEATHSNVVMGVDVALIDTPRTIQVIPEQLILDQQSQDLRDVMQNVSGATARNDAGGTRDAYVLRGFEMRRILQDGMQLSGSSLRVQTENIERVEVIKGPNSNLLGRSYPGGVINVITKKPLESSRKVISATFDEFGRKDSQLDLTGPLSSDGSVLYRMVMAYEDTKTFRETDQKAELKRTLIAPSLTWKISDTDRITYGFEYSDIEMPIDSGAVSYKDSNTGKVIYSDRFKRLGEHGDTSKAKQSTHHLDYEHDLANGWLVSAKINYQDLDLNSSQNRPRSIDEATATLVRDQSEKAKKAQSLLSELSLSGEFDTGSFNHQFAVGIDYNWLDIESTLGFGGNSTPINIQSPVYGTAPTEFSGRTQVVEAVDTQIGFRVQDMITINEDWVLSAGVRVDNYKKVTTASTLTTEIGLEANGEVSPNLGLIYHASPYFSPYISYSESFTTNSAGYNATTGEFVNAPPSEGKQHEVGVKGSFGGDKINYNLSYFDLSFTNRPAGTDATGAPIYDGEQASKGVEFNSNIQFSKGLYMLLNLSHIDTEVVTGSRKGNELPNAPNFIGNLWLTYEHQEAALAGLGYGGGIRHVGKRFADGNNDLELDSYTTLDLTAHYYLPIKSFNSKLRIQAGVKNIMDEEYHVPNNGTQNLGVGQPRTIYGSIGVEF